MRKLSLLVMIVVSMLIFASCADQVENTADQQMQVATAQQMNEAFKEIGMPAMKNFQERKLMKMILELRDDEDLICYAYLYNRNDGSVGQFLGKCLGFGLPYSVQYTNPYKIVDDPYSYQSGGKVLPQADPNGLFMPTGLSATWLMLLDEEGNPHPVYIEPEIIVSPFKFKE